MSDRLTNALSAIRHLRGERVFYRTNATAITPKTVEVALHRACRAAGIRRISWHKLRHSFASHLELGEGRSFS